MYKKGTGDDKQGKDAGNRTLCPYRNFSQAIKFSSWLTAICGGEISKSQSLQTASRAMKFLEFCSSEDEDELTSSFIDYCLGCQQLITAWFCRSSQKWVENWKFSPAQLFTCASADALRNFGISEVYLTRGKKFLARQKKMDGHLT